MFNFLSSLPTLLQTFATAIGGNCDPNIGASHFLAFPTWYEYLGGVYTADGCMPQVNQIVDIWLILAAIIDIMLRISSLVAIAFVMYGGFKYMTSHGDPSATKGARQTVINALIGLVLAVTATALVTFIAGRFR